MIGAAGFNPVDHLYAANFNHSVAAIKAGVKTGCFRVENNFSHKFNIVLFCVRRKGLSM